MLNLKIFLKDFEENVAVLRVISNCNRVLTGTLNVQISFCSLTSVYRSYLAYALFDIRVDQGMGDQRNSGSVDIHRVQLRELQVVQQVQAQPADARRQHLTW